MARVRRRRRPRAPTWHAPRRASQHLGPLINTAAFEGGPSLSANGLELYFVSARAGALGGPGDQDIYVSRRRSIQDEWEAPARVPPPISSPYFDITPSVSRDGLSLYFASSRPGPFSPPTAVVALSITMLALPNVSHAQRRGGPGVVVPMTDVSITLGDKTVTGRVDAHCKVDEKATPTNTRGYFVVMYPWFGKRVAPDKPQWRFDLMIRRGKTTEASDVFTFSFMDGERGGVIQTEAGSRRIGSGTVRVTREGKGARFEVEGKTKEGQSLRATITCSEFQKSEAAGG